jgi:hypothetical protein
MDKTTQLNNLAKYYRSLLFELSTRAGKHFIDINAVLRYGLAADLSLFVSEIEELISRGNKFYNRKGNIFSCQRYY